MRATVSREPDLVLPDLPPGVTEVRITRAGKTHTLHSLKPWTEVMAECERRFTTGRPIGGPKLPAKISLPKPTRRPAPRPFYQEADD